MTIRIGSGSGGLLAWSQVAEPWHLAHRLGGGNLGPDNSIEAMDQILALGHTVCDGGDLWVGRDGALLSCHNSTIDTTMAGTGTVTNFTSHGWKLQQIDAGSWFSPAWGNLVPPTFDDILERCRRLPCVITPEMKTSGTAAMQKMIDRIVALHLQRSVMATSTSITQVAQAAAAGLITAFITSNAAVSAATLLANGVNYLFYDHTVSAIDDTYLASVHAAGIKNVAFTFTRRSDVTPELLRPGVVGIVSDDPLWTAGTAPLLTTDPFANKTYYHGMIEATGSLRPMFNASGRLALDSATGPQWILQGWGSQATPPASITFTATFDAADTDATRWGGIIFGCPDDRSAQNGIGASTGNGYLAFVRQNGNLQLVVQTGSSGTTLAQKTSGGSAISAGGTAQLKVEFLAGNVVKLTRVDTGESIQAVDATYRGGYFHLGKNSTTGGLRVSFSGVTVA